MACEEVAEVSETRDGKSTLLVGKQVKARESKLDIRRITHALVENMIFCDTVQNEKKCSM